MALTVRRIFNEGADSLENKETSQCDGSCLLKKIFLKTLLFECGQYLSQMKFLAWIDDFAGCYHWAVPHEALADDCSSQDW